MAKYRIKTFLSENDLLVEKRFLYIFWRYCMRFNSIEDAKKAINNNIGYYKQHRQKVIYKY